MFHLLKNPVYLGKIRHRDEVHEGEHQAIVDADLFERVQRHLGANTRRHRDSAHRRIARAPLAGRLFDAGGEPMSPTTSRGKSGCKYRYYVSASLQQRRATGEDTVRRLSATTIERIVAETLAHWLPQERSPLDHLVTLRLHSDGLLFELARIRPARLVAQLSSEERLLHDQGNCATILLTVAMPFCGGKRLVMRGANRVTQPDPVLIAVLRRAHAMLGSERGQPVIHTAPVSPYERMILRLAFLAPDIQRDILKGEPAFGVQPRGVQENRGPARLGEAACCAGMGLTTIPCYAD